MSGPRQNPGPRDPKVLDPAVPGEQEKQTSHEHQAQLLRLLWIRRSFLGRSAGVGLLLATVVAFLIPNTYTSTAQLMPPDSQSASSAGLAMISALAGKSLGGFAGLSSDLLSMKSSGALFVGVLRSETAQDRIVQQYGLQHTYGKRLLIDAQKTLDSNTSIAEDRKSGIISISVSDHDAQRSAALANAYVDQLNFLVASLSTSAAHRERVFLEGRLKVAKVELDDATNQLAQFSSKNNTLDIQTEGKAMLDAASTIAGQLIFAESELQGLRQIYTDNNARVRSMNARVVELRKQLEKLGGNPENPQESPKQNQADNGQTNSVQRAKAEAIQGDDPPEDKAALQPFPTIRSLPLLGAKYSDYYRRAKIQETVYELLTEQYEMAKVQEAKETPSVKVLDPGRVPEKKSFPPRLFIMLAGAILAFGLTAFWILINRGWEEVNPADPRKVFALEVASTLRANAPWASHNGHATWSQKIWSRVKNHRPPTDGPFASS